MPGKSEKLKFNSRLFNHDLVIFWKRLNNGETRFSLKLFNLLLKVEKNPH